MTSLIHRIANSSVKILEHGEQRLHTMYMQDKSSKPKLSIYGYSKLTEAGQFKLLQNTAPQAPIDGGNIWTATWLYNIVVLENLASQFSYSWFLKLETWSLHLETRSSHSLNSILASRNSKRSSFKMQRSSLEFLASSINLLLSGTVSVPCVQAWV